MKQIDQASPRAFWKYSNEYFRAALLVQPRPNSLRDSLRQRISMPAYFLVGHAIELAFKSFLRKRGVPVAQLKKYGHDLEALIAEAKRRKLGNVVKVSESERKAVVLFNRIYRAKELEYLTVGSKALPAYEVLVDFAEKLVIPLRDFVSPQEPNNALQRTREDARR